MDNKLLLELGNTELRLVLFIELQGKECIMSMEEIAKMSKLSKRQTYRVVRSLDFKGLAEMESLQGGQYRFVLVGQKEASITDKIIEDFPELAGLNVKEMVTKLGNKCLRGKADKQKYRDFLVENGWTLLFKGDV